MDRVIVYDVPDDGKKCLGRDSWTFVYFEREGLVLDSYAHEERDSLRKKFVVRRLYNRLSHMNRYAFDIEGLNVDQAPLPDWVIERARELFMSNLKVGKWHRP